MFRLVALVTSPGGRPAIKPPSLARLPMDAPRWGRTGRSDCSWRIDFAYRSLGGRSICQSGFQAPPVGERIAAHGWLLPMMVRRTVGRGKSFLVACAGALASAAGCGARLRRPRAIALLARPSLRSTSRIEPPASRDAWTPSALWPIPWCRSGFARDNQPRPCPSPRFRWGPKSSPSRPAIVPLARPSRPQRSPLPTRRCAPPPCRLAPAPASWTSRRAGSRRATAGSGRPSSSWSAARPMRWCGAVTAWRMRGAVYSARQHFLEALALTARSLDLAEGTQVHSRSLAEGNTALVESRQLVAPAGASLDLARIVAVHRTAVLKSVPLDQLSSIVAQQRDLTFAQDAPGPGRRRTTGRVAGTVRAGQERAADAVRRFARCWRRWANRSPATRQRSRATRGIIWRPTSWE